MIRLVKSTTVLLPSSAEHNLLSVSNVGTVVARPPAMMSFDVFSGTSTDYTCGLSEIGTEAG